MGTYKALQSTHIIVKGRLIEAVAGEECELTDDEYKRIAPGYFAPTDGSMTAAEDKPSEAKPLEEKKKKR